MMRTGANAIIVIALIFVIGCGVQTGQRTESRDNAAPPAAEERTRPRNTRVDPSQMPFDYYLLSLSWAPAFCADPRGHKSDLECGTGRHVGFVVHGLWPQKNSGERLEDCGPASPVGTQIVNSMLSIMPDRGLIQHEWATHGTCSGLNTADYFAQVQQAFANVKIPNLFTSVQDVSHATVQQVESSFIQANPGAAPGAFRVSCPNNELMQIRACLTKDLKYMECPDTVRECHARSVSILPLQ